MNDVIAGRQEFGLVLRPLPSQPAPLRVHLTPRLRTAMRAARAGDWRAAPAAVVRRWARHSPGEPTAHRPS